MAKAKSAETITGTGRRKSAVARVRITSGSGKVTINRRDLEAYFGLEGAREKVRSPLVTVGCENDVDLQVRVQGGGIHGQAGAVALGVARALIRYNGDFEEALREHHFLTVDARKKERKKYGKAGARRSFQFSKR